MSVIAFPNLSPQGPNPRMSWELRSLTARQMSPLNGVATTLERLGSHWAVTMPYENLADDRRARLQTFVASARGHAQRFYVPVYGWTRRGSFPASELLTNNTFENGTTGWTASGDYVLSASDGVLRLLRSGMTAASSALQSGIAVTAYVPYAVRCLVLAGRGTSTLIGPRINGTTSSYADVGSPGLQTAVMVGDSATSVSAGVQDQTTSGLMAGDYWSVPYISLARCALVDNGPNLLVRSDEFDTASWSKTGVTVTADTPIDPLGTTTADFIVEDGSTGQHGVTQTFTVSASAADFCLSVAVKASTRSFVLLEIFEASGSSRVNQYYNLSTGAVGSTGTTGANWANRRASIVDLGNSWHKCTLVGRKTNAATSITVNVLAATADGTSSYTGTNTANAIAVWRATASLSSVASRLRQTTSAATTGTLQTGGAIHLKGLPASTNGLLLQGDPVEIITNTSSQLVRTRAPLNSDAAGLGYFEFEPPLRVSPLDNAAVIIENPLCRMMMDSNVNGWMDHVPGLADLEFAAVEDTAP